MPSIEHVKWVVICILLLLLRRTLSGHWRSSHITKWVERRGIILKLGVLLLHELLAGLLLRGNVSCLEKIWKHVILRIRLPLLLVSRQLLLGYLLLLLSTNHHTLHHKHKLLHLLLHQSNLLLLICIWWTLLHLLEHTRHSHPLLLHTLYRIIHGCLTGEVLLLSRERILLLYWILRLSSHLWLLTYLLLLLLLLKELLMLLFLYNLLEWIVNTKCFSLYIWNKTWSLLLHLRWI